MKKWFSNLGKILIDDNKNKKVLGIAVYSVLSLVALVMTIMNIITGKGALTLATAGFALLCVINLVLTLCSRRGIEIAKALFSAEILILFTFFLISGNPEGFSAIWICLLPSLGMLFFGRERGSILCVVMFVMLAYLLWFPSGNELLQFEYTASFKMRFPVLFIAFHVLALFLETLRLATLKEMTRLQKLYRELSVKDTLTGVLNRQGIYSELETSEQFANAKRLGVVMFDIDFFKFVNDTYGHNAGDLVLKGFARHIRNSLNAKICRWGGEEFVAVYTDDNVTQEQLARLKDIVEEHVFEFEGQKIRITASMGVFETENYTVKDLDQIVEFADHALYQAKEAGRNRIVRYGEEPNRQPIDIPESE